MIEFFDFLDGLNFAWYLSFFLAVLWLSSIYEIHSLRKQVNLFVRQEAERREALIRSRKLLCAYFSSQESLDAEPHLRVFWEGFRIAEEAALR